MRDGEAFSAEPSRYFRDLSRRGTKALKKFRAGQPLVIALRTGILQLCEQALEAFPVAELEPNLHLQAHRGAGRSELAKALGLDWMITWQRRIVVPETAGGRDQYDGKD